MGMHIGTACNHDRRYEGIIADIGRIVRSTGASHSDMLAMREARLFKDRAWSRVPHWVRDRAFLRFDAMYRGLYCLNISPSQYDRNLALAIDRQDVPEPAYLRWALRLDGIVHLDCSKGVIEHIERDGLDRDAAWKRVEGAHIWNHKRNRTFDGWTVTMPAREPKADK